MKTRFLKFAVGATFLAGMILAAIPFIGSLAPSQKADSLVALINVDDVQSGSFVEEQSQFGRVFALRDRDEVLRVYLVPHHDGQYWLPDPNWERAFYPCKDFGPDSDGDRLVAGGLFRCRESNVEWVTTDEGMTWAFSGENETGVVADMQTPRYERVGNHLVVKGRAGGQP